MGQQHSYRANAFSPGTGARVQTGELQIEATGVRFQSPTETARLPFARMRLRRGGHNDEQMFFEHPDFSGWSIYSSDSELLQDAILRANPEFAEVLRSVERARRRPPATVYVALALLALLVAALALLWLAKDPLAEYVASKVPIAWEEKLGDQIFAQVAAGGTLLTNSPWQGPLHEITERLRPAARDSGYHFRFHILRDTNVNAFAIPGGNVVILTGLLEKAETAEEVAGVLAHELAHVTRRHSLRNIIKSAGLVLLVQTLVGDATGLLALATESSRFLLQQKFSRDYEREADDVGWSYLVEAKIDPRGMIRFFEKLKQQAESASSSSLGDSLALLSTHPASVERIERLNAKWRATADAGGFKTLPPYPRK